MAKTLPPVEKTVEIGGRKYTEADLIVLKARAFDAGRQLKLANDQYEALVADCTTLERALRQ